MENLKKVDFTSKNRFCIYEYLKVVVLLPLSFLMYNLKKIKILNEIERVHGHKIICILLHVFLSFFQPSKRF